MFPAYHRKAVRLTVEQSASSDSRMDRRAAEIIRIFRNGRREIMTADEFDRMLAQYCAPTLLGVKPANLFSAAEPAEGIARDYSERLAERQMRIKVLAERGHRSLVFVYRPKGLQENLRREENSEFLRSCGYCERADSEAMIARLQERLNRPSFPHEIGIFLGYPAEDVRGFINNRGRNFRCCGDWKVYGDPHEALETFRRYRRCRELLLAEVGRGNPLWESIAPDGKKAGL